MSREALRIANCSGFFGDRLSAAREMVDGGPIDVLTGDWLAELTMGVLLKQRSRDPEAGYAGTFVTQLRDVLADCLERGITIVSNAGGLNPEACAAEVEKLVPGVKVAVVTGDDAGPAFAAARAEGWPAPHLDTGAPLTVEPEVASAYLGCWGIAEALAAGADVVITGRVSDASVIAGPAAWHFGWKRDDWDALAGAVAAGHVIECGAQTTGGNYAFFTEIADLSRAGFPIAEVRADGSAVITKHPGTGGAVTVETVTAQLLYEIDGPRYLNPDVVARFDTLRLTQEGPDRVLISGTRGEPAPATVKVGAVSTAGWRNQTTLVLTGLDIEAKAELAQRALWAAVPGGRAAFDEVSVQLLRADRPDPRSMDEAVALLTIGVTSTDRRRAASLSRGAVETALASYPGFFATEPPGPSSAFTVFWPTLMPADAFPQHVRLGDRTWTVDPMPPTPLSAPLPEPPVPSGNPYAGPTRRVPLGTVLGARSGDKGGNATLGLWARDDVTFDWLAGWLTPERLADLVPGDHELRPWWLPNLRAAGATVVGLLGAGVAANLDLDAQAKALGELVRARHVDIPTTLT
ncbi:acyclic terpene utilization AtuA family protein [Pseudonocardia sp. TRM90224]|uniref:acyclic terpene utilization AtuA family protein n=1 Tax=Pseudonocardia sp. TRM90224 TaxID=2812678 RepID=UPI001E5C0653|nr:acyclic terpene utilization AtuA family protein [Pseudonocardia sp. TRM90224]